MGKTAVLVLGVLLLPAPPAFAGPSFEACVHIAPKSCALTEKSPAADVLKCFENRKLDQPRGLEPLCSEELSHAKVHDACGKTDIPALCGKVKKGGSRTMSCLKENREKLTKPCSSALDRWYEIIGSQRKKRGSHGVAAVRC